MTKEAFSIGINRVYSRRSILNRVSSIYQEVYYAFDL